MVAGLTGKKEICSVELELGRLCQDSLWGVSKGSSGAR